MPRSETIVSIFLASPGDVEEERNKLDEVVREINLVWSPAALLRFEVLRWETHTRPSMGIDPQDVVNRQMSNTYDIFIGVFWSRLGTTTGRAASGTVEEFERARERSSRTGSPSIMLYFKDKPLRPSEFDPSQLQALQNFKSSIKSRFLHFTFSEIDEFANHTRLHLSRYAQETSSSYGKKSIPDASAVSVISPAPEDSQIKDGIIDLDEKISIEAGKATESLNEYSTSTELYANTLQKINQDLRNLKNKHGDQINSQHIKPLVQKATVNLRDYNGKIEVNLQNQKIHFRNSIDAIIKRIEISYQLNSKKSNIDDVLNLSLLMKNLKTILNTNADKLLELDKVVKNTPPLSRDYSIESARLSRNIVEMVDECKSEISLLNDAITAIDRFVADRGKTEDI